MSASQRTKGHSFERKVASLLRELFPEAKRGYQTRGGTKEAPDVDGTPFYIECKKGKKTNIKAAFEQARVATMHKHWTEDQKSIRPPVAVTQDDRGPILVTMDMQEWKALVRKAYAPRPELKIKPPGSYDNGSTHSPDCTWEWYEQRCSCRKRNG